MAESNTRDPTTRASLLIKIGDPADDAAWREFESLYRPVVIRLARQYGLQMADAEDLAQSVMISIAGAIQNFEHDPARAKFRTWLRTIARRAIINAVARRPIHCVDADRLATVPQPETSTASIQIDYRRETFMIATQQIKPEFAPEIWDAFWQTVVVGQNIDEYADQNQRTRGSVYTARSRVIARLKVIVGQLDPDGDNA